jgi:hypothetical protein
MIRFVAWLVALGWIAWLMKRLFEARAAASGSRNDSRRRTAAHRRPAVRLERDPCCGTFVSPEISFLAEQMDRESRVVHFCSAECRARYLRLDRRTASYFIAMRSAQCGSEGEKH